MKEEIKKIFLIIILSCVGVFLFESMLVLSMLLFYGFLEMALTAFALGTEAKEFLVGLFGFSCVIGIIAINFVIIATSMNNSEKIKNKISEWIK